MNTDTATVIAHFVTFFSPGTFVAETSTRPIEEWNTELACEMAHEITERYNATPYGFRFHTRERGPNDLDSEQTQQSAIYYLGGKIETLAEIEARDDPSEKVLLSNMKTNGYDRVLVNTNSWKWTAPLEPGDIVLDWTPRPKEKAEARA